MNWKDELWSEWTIEESIGHGSFGTVYRIVREEEGMKFYAALKVVEIPSNEFTNINDLNELLIMEKLKGNTNIVAYEDHRIIRQENAVVVLIRMELLSPLNKYVVSHNMSEYEVIKMGMDICKALEIFEREGILHRDIKPGNIFVSEYSDYKLGDFGIAKELNSRRVNTGLTGTISYMTPEAVREQDYNQTVDIYALGLVMYRLLNRGFAPFIPLDTGVICAELIDESNYRRLHGQVLPFPCDASEELANIILKACSYRKNARYMSARDMLIDLQKCYEHCGKDSFISREINKKTMKYKEKTRALGSLAKQEEKIAPKQEEAKLYISLGDTNKNIVNKTPEIPPVSIPEAIPSGYTYEYHPGTGYLKPAGNLE